MVDIEASLKASRLRLNPTKTQVMWLGSQQQLARLDMAAMPVLSPSERVQETARDLCVVIVRPRRRSLSKRLLPTATTSAGCPVLVGRRREDNDPGLCYLSPGLL